MLEFFRKFIKELRHLLVGEMATKRWNVLNLCIHIIGHNTRMQSITNLWLNQ